MRWKCFVLLLAVAAAVAEEVPISDEYDTWWSDEVNNDQLGVDKPADYAQVDNLYYDDPEDQPDNGDAAELEQSDLFKDLFENQNKEEAAINQNENQDGTINQSQEQIEIPINEDDKIAAFDSKQVQEQLDDADNDADDKADQTSAARDEYSQAVRDDIEKAQQELDGLKDTIGVQPEEENENLDDYQIEDNRSQGKEQNKADLPSDSDGSFEPKDVFADDETNPNENSELKNPELLGAVDIPSELDQDLNLLSETKALLEEQNSPPEENFETDLQAEIMVDDNKNVEPKEDQKAAKDLLEEKNSPSEEDFEGNQSAEYEVPENNSEKSDAQNNLDIKYTEEINQFFEDVIENQQNEKIESYIDENQSKQEERIQDETNDQDIAKEENAPTLDEAVKYENDMIDLETNDDLNDGFKQLESDLVDDVNDTDDDTVDKVYADLNADLEKLLEIGSKLTDNSETEEVVEDVAGYEEKYNKPYGEDTILSQRQDYYDEMNDESADTNLGDIFESQPNADRVDTDNDRNHNVPELDLDYNEKIGKIVEPEKESETNVEADNVVEPEPKSDVNEKTATETQTSTTVKTIDVEDLSPSQYNDLMTQFAATHVEEIDTLREDFGKNIPPVHITLTDTDVTEITSPNFPNTYPTNNVVDWILEGEGTGIELNVTDLEMRGVQGDFLLIKPGGADDSGHDGIVFSYHLNEPRKYRFTDVNRVFVRFQSGPGLGFLKGFRMTVKMIWPKQQVDLGETPPTPAPLIPSPPATFTVTLGGLGKKDFLPLAEDFRKLLADMATMYMFAEGIDAADNATSEVTQITGISSCNVNWPGWEQCVLVTFGVPLVYDDEEAPTRLDEEDLKSMWKTYSGQDPFATRLRLMGLTVFAVPDDGRVMATWLVLEVAAMVCAVLLAFALWRYSCMQDYTRMKSYSDTDSVREKRDLDLYPTPHQTLPPLFSETDYQWADQKYDDSARVDMGGFTNGSFVRDELLDIESDEEPVATRDSKITSIAPRNPYDYQV